MPHSWQTLSITNAHIRDKDIVFDEPTHVYTINGVSKGWISCTKFIHNYFPHFDADAVIKKMMASPKWPNNKYFGKSAEQIKREWNENGKNASVQGTALHLAIEQFMHGQINLIESSVQQTIEWKYFKNFWNDMKDDLVPYRSEWEVWSEEYKLAGSIDMVFYRKSTDSYVIYDWKRSKEIKTTNDWEKGIGPLEHLPSSNYWQYTLQLNIYKWFLETYYGLKITELCIVIFYPENSNYKLFRLNNMKDEVEAMLQDRKETM
jgi:ATP-dependent exoDNAse (exonuclease V) beta subunit